MIRNLQALLLIVLFAGCTLPSASTPTEADYGNIRVIEVIDGDTVKLANGKLLRYIGIDTPETRLKKGNKFIYAPQPFAVEAKKVNEKLVINKVIKIEFDVQKEDRYGRLLGYCFVGDTFINAQLVKEGYAVISTYPPNVKYAEVFLAAQKEARQQRKGLWGAYETIDAQKASSYINQIRTVRGKVLNAHKSKRCVLLNFGQDYKQDFTVVIFDNSFKSFYDRGIDPVTYYRGKTIEVSGRIRRYNGPEIIVNTPGDIVISEETPSE
ncbi:MAG: thermonuclease family protein [Candidatus Omnitrophica bacterium]|nr:thermonuclease family protein [Candidatus Omnitrophota bacterium]